MSLLSYFSKTKIPNEGESSQSSFFLSEATDSGLGQQEYEKVVSNAIDLASFFRIILTEITRECCKRNAYTHCSCEKE